MASKKKKGAKSTQATPAKQAPAKAQPSQHGSRLHIEPSSGQESPEKVQPPAHGGSQASISRAHSKSSARPSTAGNNKPSTPGLKKAGSSGPLPDGVHLTAAASGDVQAAGAHKAGSKHRKKWPRGTRRQALAWGLFFMSLGALVTILGILWLEPADEGNGAQINIPLPGTAVRCCRVSAACMQGGHGWQGSCKCVSCTAPCVRHAPRTRDGPSVHGVACRHASGCSIMTRMHPHPTPTRGDVVVMHSHRRQEYDHQHPRH